MSEFIQKRQPEYTRNKYGDLSFSKMGDRIVFGETSGTKKLDDINDPLIAKIDTFDGNSYIISEGVLIDTKNGTHVDLLQKSQKDKNYEFPSILIGYKLPFKEISQNLQIPDGEGGSVLKVTAYGVDTASVSEQNPLAKKISDAIHQDIRANQNARDARGW